MFAEKQQFLANAKDILAIWVGQKRLYGNFYIMIYFTLKIILKLDP